MKRRKISYYREIGLRAKKITKSGNSFCFTLTKKELDDNKLTIGTRVRTLLIKVTNSGNQVVALPISPIQKLGNLQGIIITRPILKKAKLEKGDIVVPNIFVREYVNTGEIKSDEIGIIVDGNLHYKKRKDWISFLNWQEKQKQKELELLSKLRKRNTGEVIRDE